MANINDELIKQATPTAGQMQSESGLTAKPGTPTPAPAQPSVPNASAIAQTPVASAASAPQQMVDSGSTARAGTPTASSTPDFSRYYSDLMSRLGGATGGNNEMVATGIRLNADGTTSPVSSGTTAIPSSTGSSTTPTSLRDIIAGIYSGIGSYIPSEVADYSDQINDIYNRMLESERINLDAGHEATMRELEAAAAKIPGLFQTQANALAAQNQQERRAFNEQAAASGLNTGASGQAALAQSAAYQGGQAQIRQAQADSQAELERQRVEIEAQYQTAIQQALADNDYQRAVALMQEMQRKEQEALNLAQMRISVATTAAGAEAGAAEADWQRDWDREQTEYNRQQQEAATLASYGDFSGYARIYGEDVAAQMQQLWQMQNPDFAYYLGQMSAEDYFRLTGQYPPGSGYGYGYGGYGTTGAGTSGGGGSMSIPVSDQLFSSVLSGLQTARTEDDMRRVVDQIPPAAYESLTPQQQADLRAAITAALRGDYTA